MLNKYYRKIVETFALRFLSTVLLGSLHYRKTHTHKSRFSCALPQYSWEAWWLNGSTPDCCPAVLGSHLASPQPTADCQSPGGLPPGMALGCRLTSVRDNRGENYENELLGCKKHIKKIFLYVFW
jgi:hypothetical protein